MSPGDEERRPAAEPGGDQTSVVGDDTADRTSTTLEVRRRRRASFRCPRMADGRQDVLELDGIPDEPQTPHVIVELGRRTAWFRVDVARRERLLYAAISATGVKYMRDARTGLLCTPIDAASDVMAYLEVRSRAHVTMLEVDR